MKILTQEEQDEHYNATLKGGLLGGSVGLFAATAGVYVGAARFPMIRHLTLPMRAFLVTSGGTFAAIISGDHYSRAYEAARHPEQQYRDENERMRKELDQQRSAFQRSKEWMREQRFKLVGGSWVASIATAWAIVNRDKYMTTAQKLVQARVYAQGFTVLVMVALAAFEISERRNGQGRWETVKIIDPDDPEHKRVIEKQVHHESFEGEDQWKDMVDAEEQRMKRIKREAHEKVKKGEVTGKKKQDHKGDGAGKQEGSKKGNGSQKEHDSKENGNPTKGNDSPKSDDSKKHEESKKDDNSKKSAESKKDTSSKK